MEITCLGINSGMDDGAPAKSENRSNNLLLPAYSRVLILKWVGLEMEKEQATLLEWTNNIFPFERS